MSNQTDNEYRGNTRVVKRLRWALQKGAVVFNKAEQKLRPKIRMDGDRIIEWSFVAGNIPDGPGTLLDFGPGHAWMGLVAVQRGYEVTEVDLRKLPRLYNENAIRTIIGDVKESGIEPESIDVIVNCSSIEHVGLTGRYGVTSNEADGDLEVMDYFRSIIKPSGRMILTIPVGRDSVFPPFHRVYGEERIRPLLEGWRTLREEFWGKKSDNRWHKIDRAAAIGMVPRFDLYALGCMVLEPA